MAVSRAEQKERFVACADPSVGDLAVRYLVRNGSEAVLRRLVLITARGLA